MNLPEAMSVSTAALNAALDDQWTTVTEAVQLLLDNDELMAACAAWCSITVAEMFPAGRHPDAHVQLRLLHESGALAGIDDPHVTPWIRWAGRMLAAFAANDEPMFITLYQSIPAGTVGEHIGALIQCSVLTIRRARAGHPT